MQPAPRATSPQVTITTHPEGFAHTRSTIATMAKLAREGSHSYEVRSTATRIVHDVPSKQVRGELQALYRWVRDNVRYRFDPVGLEWVQSPARTIAEQAGDCDDMATLLAAFAGSLGHKWRFHTVGPTPTIMKHVAVEAWDGTEWVTLDPVLEPPGRSTAPRSDVGMFGRTAPARARHTWSAEGDMLSGPVGPRGVAMWNAQLGASHTGGAWGRRRPSHVRVAAHERGWPRRRSRGLSGAVAPEQYELWSWAAYYPSDPQVRTGAGIAPTPSPVYRSAGAPGPAQIILAAPAGDLSGGLGYVDGLGFGFLKKIGKAVGGVVKGVAKVATSIPGVSTIAKIIPGASLALDAAKMVGGMLSPDKPSGGGGGGAPAPAPAAAGGNPYAPAGGGGGGGGAPAGSRVLALAQRSDIDSLRNEIRANAGLATRADLNTLAISVANRNSAEQKKREAAAAKAAQKKGQAAGAAAEKKKATKAIAKMQKKNAAAIAKRQKAIAALKAKAKALSKTVKQLRKQPCPAVGRKYPPGSRQAFDAKRNRYVVYTPQAGAVAGLGFIKPTISFTLGAFGLATATQAAAAVKSVADFIKKNKGASPQVPLAAVKAFQQSDGKLTADGLWGPNARAAASWYLNQPISALPPPAKPYAKGKVTWKAPAAKPPVVAAAKPAAKPAPVAVVAKPKASKPKAAPKPAPVAVAKPKASKPKAAPKPAPVAVVAKPKPQSAYAPKPAAPRAPSLVSTAKAQPVPAQLVPSAPVPPVPKAPKQTAPVLRIPGMEPAGIEQTNPGLPPVGIDSGTSATRSSTPPRLTIEVSGPRIVPAASSGKVPPLVWLALGYYVLQRGRRAA